jgi:hypothetical protein
MPIAISASSRMRECWTAKAEEATSGTLCLFPHQFFDIDKLSGVIARVAGVAVLHPIVTNSLAQRA